MSIKNDDFAALKPQLRPFAALTDAEVVARVLDGDQPLFELLMRRYNRRLFRCAWSVLRDEALAQDAVQEAYLVAFQHLQQFRGPAGFGAWLARIAVRQAGRLAAKRGDLELVADPAGVAREGGPDRTERRREVAQELEIAISALPQNFRLVFVLREIEELSIDETAAVLEVSVGTVKSRLNRAKQTLRQLLGPDLGVETLGLEVEPLPFAGARCDAIVATVFARLSRLQD